MNEMAMQDGRRTELRPWQHGLIFLFAFAILTARRPDAIFHAQFWAEDGHVFYADAYNLGWWRALFHTNVGYFHAVPRIGAALALLVPLVLAPLVLNVIAIAAQALPVNLLLSHRSAVWGSFRYRALLAGIYLALPNCRELSATITNSQCLLALGAFLLLVASTPKSVAGKLFDIVFLLICGLSGPYCIFLLPIAVLLAWKHRDRWRWVPVATLTASCLVEAWGLLVLSPTARPHYFLGASPKLFTDLIAGQIYLATLLGSNGLAFRPSPGLSVFLLLAAIGGTAIFTICVVKSTLEMRLLILFSSMVVAASLISPTARPIPGISIWEQLAVAVGVHYWFFPTLAFAWSLVWCFQSRAAALKTISGILLCLMCIGIIRDWRHTAFKDLQFRDYASRFEASPPGTVVTIPLNPEGWDMRLTKPLPAH
jgi:hypothetical protein